MKFNGWYKEDTVQNKSNVLKEHILSYKGCVTNGNFPQKKKKKKKIGRDCERFFAWKRVRDKIVQSIILRQFWFVDSINDLTILNGVNATVLYRNLMSRSPSWENNTLVGVAWRLLVI